MSYMTKCITVMKLEHKADKNIYLLNVRIPMTWKKKMDQLAKKNKVSQSDLVREALFQMLQKTEKKNAAHETSRRSTSIPKL